MPSGEPSDTNPKVEAFIIEGYRRMSAAQKMARVTELTKAVQQLALADIRRRYLFPASLRERITRDTER